MEAQAGCSGGGIRSPPVKRPLLFHSTIGRFEHVVLPFTLWQVRHGPASRFGRFAVHSAGREYVLRLVTHASR